MSATWVTFLFEAANFLLLAAVLGWLFFRPVRAAIERRRSELEHEGRAASDARAEAERALSDAQARRTEVERSLEELRERIRREGEREREQLLDAAREQARREREAFQGELASLRRAQARSLTRDAALAAREIVVRLLDAMQGPDLEKVLLATACRELEKLRSSGALAPVTVDAARPLDGPDLSALAQSAGIAATELVARVDAGLVAGLRVLTARGLIDASAAGLATQAERVLVEQLEREGTGDG